MKGLIGDNDIISDELARYKGTLVFGDNKSEDLFQMVGQNFRYQFVYDIAKTNGSKVRSINRIF